ncbi:uncharacterized protein LOC135951135 [Calliphora vicina]|uniref:uncharacterized protein LOC135951135 n=1 Tax=Calliphora vicina TaxID=7373 RepID=UPI00325B2AF1
MSLKVNKLFLNIILIIFSILNTLPLALGGCLVRFDADTSLRPNLFLKIGSHTVDLTISDADTFLSLHNEQELEAHCSTKFEFPSQYNTNNKIFIKCDDDNYIYIKDNNGNYRGHSRDISFVCSSVKWNLYETSNNFVWCPSNVTSYILARPKESPTTNYEYLAGICYDTHNLSFKSLYYTIAPKNSEHLHPTDLSSLYTPSIQLEYLKETFAMKSVRESDFDHKDIQDWMKYAQYNFSSAIQNSILYDDFNNQLGSILDLAWWPPLRLGNWKRYETALAKQVENQNQVYDILAGVSAVAMAPIIKTCDTYYTLKELIDNRNHKIPMYIWNYLRSTSNSSDEIVVIGFNSPFFEFYSENDVIFCADKCQEIPWLQKVSTTFHYSALGVIFCCSVEDVITSNRLEGFPTINTDTKPQPVIETTLRYN